MARTTAWTTPLLVASVAAPAYAASGDCRTQAVLQSGTSPVNLTFPSSTVSAAVGWSATNADGTPRSDVTPGETGEVRATSYIPAWNYLKMHLPRPLTKGETVTLTLTLTKSVKNLSLTITDIDKFTTSWIDEVVVSPLGFTSVLGPNVIGFGTSAAPFTSNHEPGISTAAGDATLTWAGPLKQVQITYRAADNVGGSTAGQHIGVGEISFDNC